MLFTELNANVVMHHLVRSQHKMDEPVKETRSFWGWKQVISWGGTGDLCFGELSGSPDTFPDGVRRDEHATLLWGMRADTSQN